jgi:hypothetical protein
LLKAGATETGLVADGDCLPGNIDLAKYQEQLVAFAKQIVSRHNTYPWYLEQQALLLLACTGNYIVRKIPRTKGALLKDYIRLHQVLSDKAANVRWENIIPFVMLQKHLQNVEKASKTFMECFRRQDTIIQRKLLLRALQEDARLSMAIFVRMTLEEQEAWNHLYHAHGIPPATDFPGRREDIPTTETTYPFLSVAYSQRNPFQQEYAVLHLVLALLGKIPECHGVLSPARIKIRAKDWQALYAESYPIENGNIVVEFEDTTESDVRFPVPAWVPRHDAWKYQLGQILRVMLTGQADYTVPGNHSRQNNSLVLYSPYRSSWLRRRYGLFNGRHAFGPNWLPVSSWMGSLLSRLLEWPGFVCTEHDFELGEDFDVKELRQLVADRLGILERLYGRASSLPILPVLVPKIFGRDPVQPNSLHKMRIGVVQTAIPKLAMFKDDPQLLDSPARFRHRRHLAAVLGGVHRMLQVRETHRDAGAGIELLILPEVSVHPLDIRTHLVPFATQHRCMIFAGVVFHPRVPGGKDLVNSGYWIIPAQDSRGSLHIEYVEQGKWHLTEDETRANICPFRPAQWLVQFIDPNSRKGLWAMSGAICYDSTDIQLAADLRNVSDMFVVSAHNKNVDTFDNMAAALHYHMYQHVIIANSGEFGGSTGQAPFSDRHHRTIFHTHGNEQATVSFFEVDLNTYRIASPALTEHPSGRDGALPLKTPPAGFDPRRRRH